MGAFGLVGSESSSEARDQRATAADLGMAGTTGAAVGASAPNSLNVNVAKEGAAYFAPKEIKLGEGATLNYGGAQEVADLSRQFLSVTDTITASTNEAFQQALEQASEAQKEALAQVAKIGQSVSTGGDSERNKIILWITLGVFSLVAAIFYFRRG